MYLIATAISENSQKNSEPRASGFAAFGVWRVNTFVRFGGNSPLGPRGEKLALFQRTWSPLMIRSSRFNMVAVLLTAFVAVLAVAGQSAEPKAVPFKITGGGTAPDGLSIFGADSPHNATGTATHLGNYSGNEGIANVLTFDPGNGTGTFQGSFVFVAANGDRLACDYGDPGTFAVMPAEIVGEVVVQFVAEFTYDPQRSTGRFASVTGGSFTMIATTEPFPLLLDSDGFTPPFDYTWTGEGTIELRKGK